MAKPVKEQQVKSERLNLIASDLKQPLHERVRLLLREQILNDFKQDDRFYSERELITQLRISQPTVRRALSDLTAEGYLVPAPRRGFFVQHQAAVRCLGLARTVCSYVDLEDDPIYFTLCRDQGLTVVTHDLHRGDSLKDLLATVKLKPAEERIIISGLTLDDTLTLSTTLKRRGFQHLVIGPHIPNLTCSSLCIDHDAEVQLVLDHLLALGHRRIAFVVNEPGSLLSTWQRAESLQNLLKKRGLPECRLYSCETPNWADSFDAAYDKAAELMKSKPAPTAIVPLSGMGSLAVMRFAYEHNIKIPSELSVLSFDEIRFAHRLPVAMTALEFSHEERAKRAIALIWDDHHHVVHEKITPNLIIRKSTSAPRED